MQCSYVVKFAREKREEEEEEADQENIHAIKRELYLIYFLTHIHILSRKAIMFVYSKIVISTCLSHKPVP